MLLLGFSFSLYANDQTYHLLELWPVLPSYLLMFQIVLFLTTLESAFPSTQKMILSDFHSLVSPSLVDSPQGHDCSRK